MINNKRFTLREPKVDNDIGCEEIADDGQWITYGEIVDLLNENELKQTIKTICKDYEESHGIDIRNAEWFTAW